jgi:gluconolactonase
MTQTTQMELLADGLGFPEGPIVLADGSCLVLEIKSQAISRVATDGTVERLVHLDGGPNGMQIGPDGRVYVCNNGGFKWLESGDDGDSVFGSGLMIPHGRADDYIGGRIQAVDLETGEVETLYTECDGHPLGAPNDIVFDQTGGFYFTDHASSFERHRDHGGLYYAQPDGSSITEVAFPLGHPNGVALSPDNQRVYVGDTLTGIVWYWDVEAPGVLARGPYGGGASLLCGLPGYQLFDSIAVDSEGNVCGATLLTGAITVIDPQGEVIAVHKVPEPDPLVTNIAFGGPDMRTAYITSGGQGRLYTMEWHCPGLPLAFDKVKLPK